MQCGCTMQSPNCAMGTELFRVLAQAHQDMSNVSVGGRAHAWKTYSDAHTAYRDHLEGCRENDVKVWRGEGAWQVELRQNAQWIALYETAEEHTLHSWLKEYAFWRYAQIDGDPKDRLTGYYHRRAPSFQSNKNVFTQTTTSLSSSLPLSVLHLEVDQKAKMAMYIALLVAHLSRPLTLVDRAHIQRRALDIFLSENIPQIERSSQAQIVAFIDEAMRVSEAMKHLLATSATREENKR